MIYWARLGCKLCDDGTNFPELVSDAIWPVGVFC